MSIEIIKTSYPLGHEIKNVDLRNVDEETFSQIEAAYDQYGVVVIRNQNLTPQEQVNFSKRFAKLDRFVLKEFNLPELPEIFVVSNIIQDGKPLGMDDAGRYWHSDMWITQTPPRGSILYAREVPLNDQGKALGDTCFASTADAYDTLPDSLKEKLENLSAVFSSRLYAQFVGHDKPKDDLHSKGIVQAQKKLEDLLITHKLVRIHPRTGRKCLYMVEGVVSHIVGMHEQESQALIAELLKHTTRESAVYRHSWRVGDLVMWDNYSAIHNAIGDFKLPQRRLMHRTTLSLSKSEVISEPQEKSMASM